MYYYRVVNACDDTPVLNLIHFNEPSIYKNIDYIFSSNIVDHQQQSPSNFMPNG